MDEVCALATSVGHGAQPTEWPTWVEKECSVCLAGNHDLVVTGGIDIADFSRSAAVAALWTRDNIGEEALSFLKGFPTR